jgi:hypothetical protein
MRKMFLPMIMVFSLLVLVSCESGLEIVGLEIHQYPDKIVYIIGADTDLDLAGLGIYIITRDDKKSGERNNIMMYGDNNFHVSSIEHEIDFNKAGIYVVTLTRHLGSCYFTIEVIDPNNITTEDVQEEISLEEDDMDEPEDVTHEVKTEPLIFIDYAENIDLSILESRTPIRFGEGDDKIIILLDIDTTGIVLRNVIYNNGIYHAGEDKFRLRWLSTDYYIEYSTNLTNAIPHEAVTIGNTSYTLSRNLLDDFIAAVEAEIIFLDPGFTSLCLDGFELAGGARVVIKEYENTMRIGFFVEYEGETEPIHLDFVYKTFGLWISPDRTKISYIFQDHNYGLFYLFDVISRETIIITAFEKPEERETHKTILWLDNNIMLVTVGLDAGSTTTGGDIFYYNVRTGENGRIITSANDSNWTEFNRMELCSEFLEFRVVVHFDGVNNHFIYTERIPLSQVYELIESGKMLVLDTVRID